MLNIEVQIQLIQRQTTHRTLKCNLHLWPSHMVLVHCTPSHDGEYLCYFEFLQLMKELLTRQAVLDHQFIALCKPTTQSLSSHLALVVCFNYYVWWYRTHSSTSSTSSLLQWLHLGEGDTISLFSAFCQPSNTDAHNSDTTFSSYGIWHKYHTNRCNTG